MTNSTNDGTVILTDYFSPRCAFGFGLALVVPLLLAACTAGDRASDHALVRSYLRGVVSVRADVDSSRDYRGFEVLVASADGLADTLGIAVTDSTGEFEIDIVAPESGIYPLLVRRRGALLKQGQIVVANGDSATMNLRIPDGSRPLIIRSPENASWMAYRNTKSVHNSELLAMVQSGDVDAASRDFLFVKTAEQLWRLREQFPGTIGASVAGAESVLLLDSINDSLLVQRASLLDPDSPGFVDVARGVRRSESRLRGLDAAIAMLESFIEKADKPEQKAAIASEIVISLADSGRTDAATQRAREIAGRYQQTPWASWANNAVYELQTLMPGMEAPTFEAQTWNRERFDFGAVRGGTVLLEFFKPLGDAFVREIGDRDALFSTLRDRGVTVVAVSVEPDSVLNEAFFETRDRSQVQIALASGLEDPLAKLYNVQLVPKRVLIQEGLIVGKYTGTATLSAIRRDVLNLGYSPPQ